MNKFAKYFKQQAMWGIGQSKRSISKYRQSEFEEPARETKRRGARRDSQKRSRLVLRRTAAQPHSARARVCHTPPRGQRRHTASPAWQAAALSENPSIC